MTRRIDHGHIAAQKRIASQGIPAPELRAAASAQRQSIIAGMGAAGQGKRAPVTRIDPSSPAGVAIAAKYARPP
jgi:hypothetical protein